TGGAVVRRHGRPDGPCAAEARVLAGRDGDAARAVSGLGHRRVPAGTSDGRRRCRPPRRALLHVPGGRGLLRGHPGARPPHSVYAGRRNYASARPVVRLPGLQFTRAPQEPGHLLRETPPALGPVRQAVFAAVSRRYVTRGNLTESGL